MIVKRPNDAFSDRNDDSSVVRNTVPTHVTASGHNELHNLYIKLSFNRGIRAAIAISFKLMYFKIFTKKNSKHNCIF